MFDVRKSLALSWAISCKIEAGGCGSVGEGREREIWAFVKSMFSCCWCISLMRVFRERELAKQVMQENRSSRSSRVAKKQVLQAVKEPDMRLQIFQYLKF